MTSLKYIERLQYLDYLIRTRSTGSPAELAEKLDLSLRSTYQALNDLKNLGAPLAYSETEGQYLYLENGKLEVLFVEEVVGGFRNFMYPEESSFSSIELQYLL